MNERPIKVKNLIAYGVGDIFGGGSFLIINMLFLFFLTDIVGMRPFLAGLAFFIGKFWDAISDPLMGYISDHTQSKHGRRRIYFILGILPIAVSFIMLFSPIKFDNSNLAFLYFTFANILFRTVYTMVMVPYTALNAEMTHDYKIRTKLTGARMIFSLLSGLISATLPSVIIKKFADPMTGHFIMAIIFGAFYALPWIIVFFGTTEIPPEGEARKAQSTFSIYKEFISLIKNKSFKVHILMYLFAYTAMDFVMMLFKYYLKWNIQKPDLFPLTMGSLMIAQLIMLVPYVIIANKKGKGFAFRIGLTIWGIGMLLTYFLSAQTQPMILVLICFMMGMGLSAGVMIPYAILPSVVDVGEVISTEQLSGLYSGAMTLLRKIANGLAAPTIGLILELSGYVEKSATQTPEAIQTIKISLFGFPTLLIIAALIASIFFKITPSSHKILKKELERLREGGDKNDVDPETRKTLETLTGLPYEELYNKKE